MFGTPTGAFADGGDARVIMPTYDGGLHGLDGSAQPVWRSVEDGGSSWGAVPFRTSTAAIRLATSPGLYLYPSGEFVPVPYVNGRAWMPPSVVDLDLDGLPEIVDSCRVFDEDGNVLWTTPLGDARELGCFHAVVQADADPEGEVLWAAPGGLVLVDTDGTPISTLDTYNGKIEYNGPCAGDFDRDGVMDVAVVRGDELRAYRLPDQPLWTFPLDFAHHALDLCTVFDFDADGADEIIVADPTAIHIIDGATGTSRLDIPQKADEYDLSVVVADLDADGSADLLVGRT
jgi:hypothetical protein